MTTSASRSPCSTSPFVMRVCRQTLPLSWTLGASGFSASMGSSTTGRTSYSTSTRAAAYSAMRSVMAATSATVSPMYRTLSPQMTGMSGSTIPNPLNPVTSAAVSTVTTPSSAIALLTSTLLIKACGYLLRTNHAYSIPGNERSDMYSMVPHVLPCASILAICSKRISSITSLLSHSATTDRGQKHKLVTILKDVLVVHALSLQNEDEVRQFRALDAKLSHDLSGHRSCREFQLVFGRVVVLFVVLKELDLNVHASRRQALRRRPRQEARRRLPCDRRQLLSGHRWALLPSRPSGPHREWRPMTEVEEADRTSARSCVPGPRSARPSRRRCEPRRYAGCRRS